MVLYPLNKGVWEQSVPSAVILLTSMPGAPSAPPQGILGSNEGREHCCFRG